MIGTRPIAVLLAAALLFGAAPLSAQEAPTAADYARREADSSPGLAEFRGGFHEVVFVVVVLAAVSCLIWLSAVDCVFCAHGGHYHRLPHAEGRRGHPRP